MSLPTSIVTALNDSANAAAVEALVTSIDNARHNCALIAASDRLSEATLTNLHNGQQRAANSRAAFVAALDGAGQSAMTQHPALAAGLTLQAALRAGRAVAEARNGYDADSGVLVRGAITVVDPTFNAIKNAAAALDAQLAGLQAELSAML